MGKYTLPEGPSRNLMAAWVADLRTPGIKQRAGSLGRRDPNYSVAHCCLGRLVILPEAGAEHYYNVNGDLVVVASDGTEFESLPPVELVDKVVWSALPDPLSPDPRDVILADKWPAGTGADVSDGHQFTASRANDILHWSFAQIADALEARYLRD